MQAVDELGKLLLAGFSVVHRLPVLKGSHSRILGRGHQLLLLRVLLFGLFRIHLLTPRDLVELGSFDSNFVVGFDKILELLFVVAEGPAVEVIAIYPLKRIFEIISRKINLRFVEVHFAQKNFGHVFNPRFEENFAQKVYVFSTKSCRILFNNMY